MNQAVSKMLRTLSSRRVAVLAALVVAALLLGATGVKAGCTVPLGKASKAPAIPFVSAQDQDGDDDASIVGLWNVVYTATSAMGPFPPTPFQFNESYKMWHADGTEFENALLPPAGGNICYGVWKKGKGGVVKLHHVGVMFDNVTGKVTNRFTVDEVNKVSHDNKTYEGTFVFKLFDATDAFGTGTPLAEVKGTTAAKRITVE
jgi:hypothetical protein